MRYSVFLSVFLGVAGAATATHGQTPEVAARIVGEHPPAGEGLPLYRSSGSVAVLAVATSRWLPVPTHPRELLGNYQFIPDDVAAGARGQLFRPLEVEGGWDVTRGTGEFVAAPWTLGCGCAEVGWQEPTWVPPGDTVAFLLNPTRSTLPEEAAPVFDVLGWHQPYPVGDFIPFWRKVRGTNPDRLSALEFYLLLRALPTDRALRLDPSTSLEGLRQWLIEHPKRSGAFPVPSVLKALGRAPPTPQGSSWTGAAMVSRLAGPVEAAALAAADRAVAAAPDDVPNLIAAARARERVWRFREAVDLYARAAVLDPEAFEPPLQQAHRLIRLRALEPALQQLDRAKELDPTGFNTAYLRGMTLYLMGEFQGAAEEWLGCLEQGKGSPPAWFQGDPRQCFHAGGDAASRVALSAWAVRALRRAGREAEAADLLESLPESIEPDALAGPLPEYAGSPIVPGDNRHYWALLRFYRGELPAEALLERDAWGGQWPTVAYGLAAWWIADGNEDEARSLLEEIVSDPNWPRLGHVAAEADLVRIRRSGPGR